MKRDTITVFAELDAHLVLVSVAVVVCVVDAFAP
jgi:hypothetical protein